MKVFKCYLMLGFVLVFLQSCDQSDVSNSSDASSLAASKDQNDSDDTQYSNPIVSSEIIDSLACDVESRDYASVFLNNLRQQAPKYCEDEEDCAPMFVGGQARCGGFHDWIAFSNLAEPDEMLSLNHGVQQFNAISKTIDGLCEEQGHAGTCLAKEPAPIACVANKCVFK